jgi:hypothetical protein
MAIRFPRGEVEAVVSHLVTQIGKRPATSRQEATAAAYINGRLRGAGLKVNTDRITSASRRGVMLSILTLLGAIAALLSVWMPLISFFGALGVLGMLLFDALIAPLPQIAPRHESQNIIGTRAIQGSGGMLPRAPRWRVVLLAPLDSPYAEQGLRGLAGLGRGAVIARMAALGLAAGIALWLWLVGDGRWWYVQIAPASYLLLTALSGLISPRHPASDGGAGALAVLFEAAQQLQSLQAVELWAVALGASATDNSGLLDLIARYPFPREQTLLLVLADIDSGQLAYVTREGALRARPADALLLRLAAEADAADPAIDAEPRPLRQERTIAAPLQAAGYRSLTLITHSTPGASTLAPQAVERAARLVVGIVQLLEKPDTGRG